MSTKSKRAWGLKRIKKKEHVLCVLHPVLHVAHGSYAMRVS
jgi:hypothetical protein